MKSHSERASSRMNGGGRETAPLVRRTRAAPVEARLRERIQAFEEAVVRTRASEHPEAIHDLRVASRRLTAFLRMWRGLIPAGCFRRTVRDIRALRRRAGRARDLEVLVGMLRERLERHDVVDADAQAFVHDLEAQLERRRHRAGRRVRSRRSRRLLDLLARGEQRLSKDLLSHLHAYEAAHAREQELRHAAIEAMRAAADSTDDAVLHRARIAIKKWRYAVESLGEGRTPGPGTTLDTLRDLQQALGAIHDRAELRAVLAGHLGGADLQTATGTLRAVMLDLETEREQHLARFRALAAAFLGALEPALWTAPRVRDGELSLG